MTITIKRKDIEKAREMLANLIIDLEDVDRWERGKYKKELKLLDLLNVKLDKHSMEASLKL